MAKIYLSNWASHKTKGCHGPGKILSIMVITPRYVVPDGIVPLLMPRAADFTEYKRGQLDLETYRARFFEKVEKSGDFFIQRDHTFISTLLPGKLMWQPYSFFDRENQGTVGDGDTLCCTCSIEKATKRECHRAWISGLLGDAGWEVVLDGKKI